MNLEDIEKLNRVMVELNKYTVERLARVLYLEDQAKQLKRDAEIAERVEKALNYPYEQWMKRRTVKVTEK